MIQSLYIAETGLNSQQKMIDVISNNIANITTPSFKKAQVGFAELLAPVPTDFVDSVPQDAGRGVEVNRVLQDFRAGELKPTGQRMDVAINGEGLLAVELADGSEAYSRAGRLQLDENGYLLTAEGHRLAAAIQLPPDSTDVTITRTGLVLARVQGGTELVELGQIQLGRFNHAEGLRAIAPNLYSATEASGPVQFYQPGEAGTGQLVQGHAEMSNVSMNEEMVSLMLAQRGYQLNARLVQVADQVLETINNIRR
ncbi:MAG TPA: flagellar basal-body rod protein FlgG [Rheinheimera sp.]|uniref:flagellar hook-basal body protein n=1 Tax=Rheinheimera sp. TaxID=1869214 RepID=UPI000ECC70BD|nr:flagellar hook-basal body protein [Rheinheimera sp.]HCU65756.1 flagellar basal-body rod protein FlgG [Rheinheimera sp.]